MNTSSQQSYTQLPHDQQIDRRRYPTDIKTGGKSEWMGMEQHLQEISQELQRNERDILALRKNEFLSELDKITMEKLQQRQQELELKQFEASEIIRRHQIYEEEKKRFLDDKMILQKQLATIYDRQKQDQIIKELDSRQQRLEWEHMSLEDNRARMQSERRRRITQRDMRAQDQEQDFQIYQLKQQDDQQRQLRDQQEQQQLSNNYVEREIIKEENYRNFYRSVADNQAVLQKMHIENVMVPLLERQKQLEQQISRNVDLYQKKLLQDELDRVMRRQSEVHNMYNGNMRIRDICINNKDSIQINRDRMMQQIFIIRMYNDFLYNKKNEKQERQKQYKDFLDQQRVEKLNYHIQQYIKSMNRQMLSLQQGRMGKEKGMNQPDLQSYKVHDPSLHTMIPGYSAQVGQLPPRLNPSQFTNSRVNIDTIKDMNRSDEQQYSRGQQFQGVGQSIIGHNPITGSHTFYQQNPYIRQQIGVPSSQVY